MYKRQVLAAVVRVDVARAATQQVRNVLDDDLAHQVAELTVVLGASLDGTAVQHDSVAKTCSGVGGEVAPERNGAALPRGWCRGRQVFDAELDAVNGHTEPALQTANCVEHVVLEAFGAGPIPRETGRKERPAQSAVAAVPASTPAPGGQPQARDPGTGNLRHGTTVGHRRYGPPTAPAAGAAAREWHPGGAGYAR